MPPDSPYWASIDFDGSDHESISDTLPRHYVDPWDLENYAYIRQHLDSQENNSEASSFGEPIETSSFYYDSAKNSRTGAKRASPRLQKYANLVETRSPRVRKLNSLIDSDYGTGKYEKIDEFGVGRKRSSCSGRYFPDVQEDYEDFYGAINFGAESDEEEDVYGESANAKGSSLLYVYQTGAHRQKIALPQPSADRRNSYSYGHRESLYGRVNDYRKTESEGTVPIYDDIRSTRFRPKNFGLSTYGHLKIDYSCSWNNLDKFIYN